MSTGPQPPKQRLTSERRRVGIAETVQGEEPGVGPHRELDPLPLGCAERTAAVAG